MPHDSVADRLAHDKTHPGRSVRLPGGCRSAAGFRWHDVHSAVPQCWIRFRPQQVDHQSGPTCTSAAPRHQAEILAAGQPGCRGEHGGAVRRSGAHGPGDGARPRWPGRPGCACAAGTRASWNGGGCSAGKCACPCSRSDLPVTNRNVGHCGPGSVRRPASEQLPPAHACRETGAAACPPKKRGTNREYAPVPDTAEPGSFTGAGDLGEHVVTPPVAAREARC